MVSRRASNVSHTMDLPRWCRTAKVLLENGVLTVTFHSTLHQTPDNRMLLTHGVMANHDSPNRECHMWKPMVSLLAHGQRNDGSLVKRRLLRLLQFNFPFLFFVSNIHFNLNIRLNLSCFFTSTNKTTTQTSQDEAHYQRRPDAGVILHCQVHHW